MEYTETQIREFAFTTSWKGRFFVSLEWGVFSSLLFTFVLTLVMKSPDIHLSDWAQSVGYFGILFFFLTLMISFRPLPTMVTKRIFSATDQQIAQYRASIKAAILTEIKFKKASVAELEKLLPKYSD